jgi:hypothetical protein
VAARAVDRLGDQGIESHVLPRRCRLVAAGELDQVGHERAELLGLRLHVGDQPRPLGRLERVAVGDRNSMIAAPFGA